MAKKDDSKQLQKKSKAVSAILKIVKWIFIVLLALIVTLLVFRDFVIETAVEKVGSYVVGTKVNIDHFNTSLGGKVELRGFTVGNPAGYHQENAFKLDEVIVDIDLLSIFTNKIKINQIRVAGMHVDYEVGLLTSNLTEIRDNIGRLSKKAEADKSGAIESKDEVKAKKQESVVEKAEKKEVEKSVEITELAIVENSISFSNSATAISLNIPLGGIVMHDIGKESDTTMIGAINEVFSQILISVVAACSNAGVAIANFAGDAVGVLGDAASSAVDSLSKGAENAGKAAQDVMESIKNLF